MEFLTFLLHFWTNLDTISLSELSKFANANHIRLRLVMAPCRDTSALIVDTLDTINASCHANAL